MALYPPLASDLQTYSAPFPFLASLNYPVDYQYAINSATADIGLAVPDAPAGDLNTSLDLVAYTIALDLALYYLRWRFERDPEQPSAPPAGLEAVHEQIQKRLDLLAVNTAKQIGLIQACRTYLSTRVDLPPLTPSGYIGGIRSEGLPHDWDGDNW